MYAPGSGVVDTANCSDWNSVVTGSPATLVIVLVAAIVICIGATVGCSRASDWVLAWEVSG